MRLTPDSPPSPKPTGATAPTAEDWKYAFDHEPACHHETRPPEVAEKFVELGQAASEEEWESFRNEVSRVAMGGQDAAVDRMLGELGNDLDELGIDL